MRFLFFICLITSQAFAQVPFATSQSLWKYHYNFTDFNDLNSNFSYNYMYYVAGDTLHNGNTWQIINKIDSIPNAVDTTFFNFFKQDAHKVYVSHDLVNTRLIYDFGANTGDTICDLSSIVDSVKLITINGYSRKQLFVTHYGFLPGLLLNSCITNGMMALSHSIWIEGIGCVASTAYNGADLVNYQSLPPGIQPPTKYETDFICFSDSILSYGANNCTQPITQSLAEVINLDIYPNPFTDYIVLSSLPYNTEVRLFDVQGLELFRSKNQSSIPTHTLNTGIYLLVYETPTGKKGWYKLMK